MSSAGFDRLRRRDPATARPAQRVGRAPDPLGRRSLFALPPQQPPAFGTVTVDCSSCEQTSAVTPARLARLVVPSVHLPLLRRGHPSWMRCPACGQRTWVRLGVRL